MAKRSTIKPDWLDAMLVAWGMRPIRSALGFPPASPMFKERIGTPARSYEPTGYSAMDFQHLEEALARLRERDEKYVLVVMRCFKPWTAREVESMLRERYDVSERTWVNWLHDAAGFLAMEMERMRVAA